MSVWLCRLLALAFAGQAAGESISANAEHSLPVSSSELPQGRNATQMVNVVTEEQMCVLMDALCGRGSVLEGSPIGSRN